jgi:hypothetical protein
LIVIKLDILKKICAKKCINGTLDRKEKLIWRRGVSLLAVSVKGVLRIH